MQLFVVQGLGSIVALLAFVWLVTGRNPALLVASTLRAAATTRSGRQATLAVAAVIVANYVEGALDPALTRWLGWDATPLVASIEGDLVGRLQGATPRALLLPLALVYVPGYLAILNAPLVVWSHRGENAALRGYVVAFVLNYLAALPFFLFAPVREVAWSGLTSATPLLERVWPGLTAELRTGSPLDNCFPSMHVSCTVTALWFAHARGPARLRILAWVVVPAIVFSTMALGIHWATDVVAGLAVGVGCSLAGERTASRAARASAYGSTSTASPGTSV